MSYCVNCGVELDSAAKKCALCETPVINPNIKYEENEEPVFSREVFEIPESKKKKFFAALASTVIAIPQIVCFLINAFIYKGSWWSLHVVGAGFLVWVIFVLPFFLKKMRTYLMWAFDTVAVSVHTCIVMNLTGVSAYYLKGALPIIALNSALVLSYILWVRAKKRHWVLKILYIVCCIAVSTIGIGAVLSFLCSVKYAFELGTICFASLIAIVGFLSYCYSSKTIRKWLSKRLFV